MDKWYPASDYKKYKARTIIVLPIEFEDFRGVYSEEKMQVAVTTLKPSQIK